MINVTFTTTELLGFDEIMEKVNDESSDIMLMYKKYNKIAEFSDLLRDYFSTEINRDEPIAIEDIETFIIADAKTALLDLICIKDLDSDDIILLFERLSVPDIVSKYLSYICRRNEFDTFLKMVVKYYNDCYDTKKDIKDITLDDILLFILEYIHFDNIFLRMKKDFDIKNK